eukprot:gnl/TRDRNA2_/TRDRNA2_195847_c0_seq1.p1 gnl/TRDRNA2_/TRDRNA2_195847_c0~~gnl/TRDRNA2_/TRDRNA2_195847_c0_seq1.p1  ORF type:complete len:427 (-),score=84.00 gnl/TRDRNA2_/TRDRNA2_195847_c0_seq1:103-1383(-)
MTVPMKTKDPTETSQLVSSRKKVDDVLAAPANGKATEMNITMNLITAGLGTGIFTLPWSTAGASIVPAIAITGAVLLLNAWTISIIIEAGERHQVFDLGALLRKLPDPMGQIAHVACNAMVWFSSFLCLVSYIIVITDGLREFSTNRPLLVVLSSLLVLPLCFLDQRRLSMTSIMCVAANVNIFMLIGYLFVDMKVEGTKPAGTCYFGLSTGSISMVSAMMQTVIIQTNVLPMYSELKDRTPDKFNRAVAMAFVSLMILCTAFSVYGYLTFGPTVNSNIVENLPNTPWGRFSQLSAAAAVAAVFPIIMGPMIAPIRNSKALSNMNGSEWVASITIIVISAAVLVTALFIKDLGILNEVNGAMSCGAFVSMGPSLVGLYLMGPKYDTPKWRVIMTALAAGGLTCSVVGLLKTDNYASDLTSACVWKA